MVGKDLLQRGCVDFKEWAVTPSPEHLIPDTIERKRRMEEFTDKIRGVMETADSHIVISHNDADGLGAIAMLQEAHKPNTPAYTTVSYNGSYVLEDAIRALKLADYAGDVFIADIAPNEKSEMDDLMSFEGDVVWFDHHEWQQSHVEYAEELGIGLMVDETECATSLIADHYELSHMSEVAEVTKDHDLWIKEDPRSDDLPLAAYALDDNVYIREIRVHGVEFSAGIQRKIETQRDINTSLEDYAVSQVESDEICGIEVGITYIKGGRSSLIGDRIVQGDGCKEHDIAIVQRPKGAGIYSTQAKFPYCHEVARHLGGGGHAPAAGFGVEALTFRELADYWVMKGVPERRRIKKAIHKVATEVI